MSMKIKKKRVYEPDRLYPSDPFFVKVIDVRFYLTRVQVPTPITVSLAETCL